MRLIILVLTFSLAFTACKREGGPREALKDFFDSARSGNADKDEFVNQTGGSFRLSIENMSEDQFEEFAASFRSIRTKSFEVVHESCKQPTKCFLTYIVNYSQASNQKPENDHFIEVKKIAELRLEDNWKIFGISNVKSYIKSPEINDPADFIDVHGVDPEKATR